MVPLNSDLEIVPAWREGARKGRSGAWSFSGTDLPLIGTAIGGWVRRRVVQAKQGETGQRRGGWRAIAMGGERAKNVKLGREYTEALRRYVRRGEAVQLEQAHALGRQGLEGGLGLLGMVGVYHRSLAQMVAARGASAGRSGERLDRAGLFFSESLAPFAAAQRAVEEANAALHRMNEELEEEVKRMAHALHDEAAQLLAAAHLALDQLERELAPAARGRLREVKSLLGDVDYQLRHLAHELRPTLLDDLGLVPAIEFLSEGVARRTGLRVAHRGRYGRRLPAAVEMALYRVVQEALKNISRHAQATAVNIRLQDAGKAVKCWIEDNGVGLEAQAVMEKGLGLWGMRERLQPLGGVVEINCKPGRGTRLLITVPREA